MNDESGNKARSKASPFFTLDISNSAVKPMKKKPCEICGSAANELLIMTCFKCRETREHVYCARVKLQRVPYLWLCEECRNYSSNPKIAVKTANSRSKQVEEVVVDTEAAPSSKTNQVEQAPSSRTDQVVNNKASIEIAPSSRTNQVEQVVPHILDQYTTDKSPLKSSCPVSPCSLVFKPQWENFLFNRSEYIDLSSDSESEE